MILPSTLQTMRNLPFKSALLLGAIFIIDPFPTSRLVSVGVLLLTALRRRFSVVQPDGDGSDKGDAPSSSFPLDESPDLSLTKSSDSIVTPSTDISLDISSQGNDEQSDDESTSSISLFFNEESDAYNNFTNAFANQPSSHSGVSDLTVFLTLAAAATTSTMANNLQNARDPLQKRRLFEESLDVQDMPIDVVI